MQYAACSDVGMRRSNNQDAHSQVLASDMQAWQRRGHIFLVADGMGAHAAGELASRMAADDVPHLYHKQQAELPLPDAILAAIRESNAKIHQRGEANAEFRSMGTTCSALLLLPQGALVAHVGDSRVYRLRGNTLHQLTFDHSLVWEMRAAGQLSGRDDEFSAIPKNVITRSLGPNPTVQVDLEGPFAIEVDDTFLLCSDGLTGRVSDEEIASALAYFAPADAGQFLTDLANLRGGPDNITCVIAKITRSQMTTRGAGAGTLTVGGHQHEPRQVHPASWVSLGVLSLTAIIMFILARPTIALGAMAGATVVALFAMLQRYGIAARDGIALTGGRRLGKGPHAKAGVIPSESFAKQLLDESARWLETWRAAGMLVSDENESGQRFSHAAQTLETNPAQCIEHLRLGASALVREIRAGKSSPAASDSTPRKL